LFADENDLSNYKKLSNLRSISVTLIINIKKWINFKLGSLAKSCRKQQWRWKHKWDSEYITHWRFERPKRVEISNCQ